LLAATFPMKAPALHFIVLQAEMYANVGIKKLVKNSLQRSEM